MTMLERLVGLRYDGVMCTRIEDGSCHAIALVTDPETGSTFSLEPGETVLEGLERFISRWEREEASSNRGKAEAEAKGSPRPEPQPKPLRHA